MRQGLFSEEQMVAIIREADRGSVAAVAKRHGISEQTDPQLAQAFRCFAGERAGAHAHRLRGALKAHSPGDPFSRYNEIELPDSGDLSSWSN